MTTGFSIVLCSRLYLITQNPRALKILIYSIIGIDILVYIPTLVSTHIPDLNTGQRIYKVAYRLEVIFAVQEVLLASLYIYFLIRFLRQGTSEDPRRVKKTLFFLCTAEAVIFVCDVVLLTLAYTDLLVAKFMVHSFMYAIKLEIEFLVLNRLVNFGQRREGLFGNFEEKGGSDGLNVKGEPPKQDLVASISRPREIQDTSPGAEVFDPPLARQSSRFSGFNVDAADEIHDEESNSLSEMERRYLGRSV
jgi:hypothetical protein